MEKVQIAVMGGSGLYAMPGLTNISEHRIDTPFGAPSDAIIVGTLRGQRVAFLPRHARGHLLTPGEVPYRANIYALKTLGVNHILSVSACGSLREDYKPGDIVIPDQIYDNTHRRDRSFFGGGLVAHVGVAEPFCPESSAVLAEATMDAGGTLHRGGTLIVIEGPRFSTKGESQAYRQLGFSIIGMTACPEAFLAREAEICYTTMAHVTDYDVWHEAETVSTELAFARFAANLELAQKAVANAVERLAALKRECPCSSALASAFATHKDRVSPQVIERLRPLVGKYFTG